MEVIRSPGVDLVQSIDLVAADEIISARQSVYPHQAGSANILVSSKKIGNSVPVGQYKYRPCI